MTQQTTDDVFLEEQAALEAQLAVQWTGWSTREREFLEQHFLAVLSTSRSNGSPQSSLIGYQLDKDSGRLLISTKRYTGKSKNVARRPKVSLVVADGHRHLVIYGEAKVLADDPERLDHTIAIFAKSPRPFTGTREEISRQLDQQQRVVIQIHPTAAALHE